MQQKIEFSRRVHLALNNRQLRSSFRSAMDGLMDKRLAAFPDRDRLELLRYRAAMIRSNALAKLPELLEQLEGACLKNGIRVHWAETIEQANQAVLQIIHDHGAKHLIKGKSMVSEEMELNRYLETHGIEVLESDLGEFIVQLDAEPPSHIVAPAIHKSRRDIARLFQDRFPDIPYSEEVDTLTSNAREILRRKFLEAKIGLSGVNFAVAETGTICLVENEGNGRMCTTLPDVHIAVTGIEKVVERLADVPPLMELLPQSATGQQITTYFNMISSPRKDGEKDGPKEVHLVLLDNGRSCIYQDQELMESLRCIRCGACMNHCPVYTRIGGHTYGSTIPGPIGSVSEPLKLGLEKYGVLATASTLCGACGEVCPVRIPLPRLLNRLRFEQIRKDASEGIKGAGSQRSLPEAMIWNIWSWVHAHPGIYRVVYRLVTRMRRLVPHRLGPWTRARKAPAIASKTLHELTRDTGLKNEP